MGERHPIIVVGAGIGGLTAALALAHAGFRVVVVERAVELSEAGAGIQLSPNAGRVLASLGLDRAIAAKAIEPAAVEVRSSASGRVLTAIPAATFRERYRFPYRIIHRADLQMALLAGARAHELITLETGATITETLKQPDSLLIRIARAGGTSVMPAGMVIAADGVWSSFREHVTGAARAVPAGMTAWRAAIASDVARELAPMNRVCVWLGREGHLVHYPIAKGAALNVVAIVPETWDRPGWNTPGDPAEIAVHFTSWTEAARRLIAAPLAWQKFAITTVDPARAWTEGRVALLGDAAHAMLPYLAQGAAMAIEDGAVLTEHLRGATDIPAALRAYEADRKPRVAKVVAASAATGRHYQASGMTALARDLALRLAGAPLILGRNDWIYHWQPPGLAHPISNESSSMTWPR